MQGLLHAFKRSNKKPVEGSGDSETHAVSGHSLLKTLSLPSGDENLDPAASPLRPTKLLAGLPSTPQSHHHGRGGPSADFFGRARSSTALSRMSDDDSDVSVPAARPAASQASSFGGSVSPILHAKPGLCCMYPVLVNA